MRIVFEILEVPIKFRLLSLSQGEVRSLGGDAVPEVLGKLNAVSDGQFREVELGISHAGSLLHSGQYRKLLLGSSRRLARSRAGG